MSHLPTLNYQDIRQKLLEKQEIAIIDLREEDPFAQNHPLFASNISLSRFEIEILNRVPRLSTEIVLYDHGTGRIAQAATRLKQYGYTHVYALEGDLTGWQQAGGELFIDVNSASKAFGEWVEHYKQTPSLSAEELQAKIDAKENIVILDARRFDEYHTMSIPHGISVPGAELVLRAPSLVKDADTTIIVNCAGRTRSIIGTQSLINAQLPHEIFALRNGTIGWTLAEQVLEQGQNRSYQTEADDLDRKPLNSENHLKNAQALAEKAGVKHITIDQLQQLQQEHDRTTYIFDVRSEAEYQAGHLAESRWVAGGQLVQETDHYAATRGARIVLVDDQWIRAYMTGSWLAQMNWEVYVLDADFSHVLTEQGSWKPRTPTVQVEHISVDELLQLKQQEKVQILDFTTATNYKKGHIPDAAWALKADLAQIFTAQNLKTVDTIVVTCGSSLLAQYAVADIQPLLQAHQKVRVLTGGNQQWKASGYALTTENSVLFSPDIDRYKRPYEGTDNSKAAMQAYLDWEFGLVDQLKKDNTHGFFVV